MKLLYPWGLLLLIAIPVLIIIYIIKNKYREKTVSSSYVWELSRKFVKKKNILNTMANLLALILQCLAIAFLAISLSSPVFYFKNGADNEVYVLDASASMAMVDSDGTSRFDKAKAEIASRAEDAVKGSTFSLIVSDSDPRFACRQISDLQVFESFLDRVQIDYAESDLDGALSLAQTAASSDEGSKFVLFTDKEVEAGDGIEAVRVGDGGENYAIEDLSYSYNEGIQGFLSLETDLISYASDATVNVEFSVNGSLIDQQEVKLEKGVLTKINTQYLDSLGIYKDFTSIEAKILGEDDLAADDEFIIYNSADFDTTSVLLVSYYPFFFQSALEALNGNGMKIDLDTASPDSYGGAIGYDIYIFDCYSPAKLPADGAVWLVDTGNTITGSGFYAQKEVTIADPGIQATYAENTSDLLYQQLTESLVKRPITISSYMRYTLNRSFTTIVSYDNLPFIFAGRNDAGQREVVFNFDLHDSDLPLRADFVFLVKNLVSYSNPQILTQFTYRASDQILFSFPDNSVSATVICPSGEIDRLNPFDIQKYTLDEVGTYDVKVVSVTGKTREVKIFSAFPDAERDPLPVDSEKRSIVLNSQTAKTSRVFDSILPVVLVAAVFLLTDWILYGHEQF